MNEIVSKYAESQNLATQGTRLWRDHYTSRIADLTRWMAEENHTQQQYMSWADEKKQKEHELARQKFDLTAQSLQGVASLMGSLSTLQNNQMAAELKAAGKNEKLKAQISKKYFEKEKRNAIAQAIINGALAVTNILATVAGSALNPAAWLGIAIAAATTAAQIGVISAQSFAKGGLVYGETIAKVGDYPGASSNPEVIAPLSDLKGLLMTQDQREGKVVFEIEGRTLVGVLQREEKLINSY